MPLPEFTKRVKYVDTYRTVVEFSRIPQEYMDRTGNLSAFGIGRISVSDDLVWNLGHGGYQRLDVSEQFFLVRFSIKVSPEFHTRFNSKQSRTFELHKHMGKIGTKSKKTVRFINDIDGSVLVQYLNHMVLCDMKTRKSIPIPERYKSLFPESVQYPDDKLQKTSLSAASVDVSEFSDVFMYPIGVRYSDTDSREHANFLVYLEYFMNCATAASLAGHFKHFTLDMALYPLEELDVVYVGECLAGDKVVATAQQNIVDPTLFYFTITKQKKLITTALLKFSLNNFDNTKPSRL